MSIIEVSNGGRHPLLIREWHFQVQEQEQPEQQEAAGEVIIRLRLLLLFWHPRRPRRGRVQPARGVHGRQGALVEQGQDQLQSLQEQDVERIKQQAELSYQVMSYYVFE